MIKGKRQLDVCDIDNRMLSYLTDHVNVLVYEMQVDICSLWRTGLLSNVITFISRKCCRV